MTKVHFKLILALNLLIISILSILHLATDIPYLQLDHDYSLGEFYETILLSITAWILYYKFYKEKKLGVFRNFSAIIFFLILDNLFSIHELTSIVIKKLDFIEDLSDKYQIESQSIAELIYFLVFGIIFILLIIFKLFKASKSESNYFTAIFIGISILLAGGVIFDFLRDTKYVNIDMRYEGFVEDFIELFGIFTTFIVAIYIYIYKIIPSREQRPKHSI